MDITELAKFRGGISVDTITELTSASGVTIDGVLLKDNAVNTDTINEKTAASGVTIDSMLIKDGKTSSNNIDWQEPTMFRNRIINGGFDIWQRGVTFTYTNSIGPNFNSDRWFSGQVGGGVSDESITNQFTTSLVGIYNLLRVRQYKASGFTGGVTRLCQIIEAPNTIGLRGQSATLSFYHRLPTGNSFSGSWVAYVRYDTDDSTINSTATSSAGAESIGTAAGNLVFRTSGLATTDWTRSTLTVTIPSTAKRIMVVFTSNTTTNDSYLDLTGVQLEPGTVVTPFEFRPYGTELALCHRYYYAEKGSTSNTMIGATQTVGLATEIDFVFSLPVEMRDYPTVGTIGTRGTDWAIRYATDAVINTTGTFASIGRNKKNPEFDFGSGTFTAGGRYFFVVLTTTGALTASAEL